jgi:hypothetical protein
VPSRVRQADGRPTRPSPAPCSADSVSP